MNSYIELIAKIKAPELTTSMLIGLLSGYKNPRKKIHDLVVGGFLKPIRQGIYLVNQDIGLRPYSKEMMSNLMYGPSYISLETALSHYGFIPERVSSTTAICLGRGRTFKTDVGTFEFHHVDKKIYSQGVQLLEISESSYCQYATPEKAILDFIYIREKVDGYQKSNDFAQYIFDSYRWDLHTIEEKVSLKKLSELSEFYNHKRVVWMASELIKRMLK